MTGSCGPAYGRHAVRATFKRDRLRVGNWNRTGALQPFTRNCPVSHERPPFSHTLHEKRPVIIGFPAAFHCRHHIVLALSQRDSYGRRVVVIRDELHVTAYC